MNQEMDCSSGKMKERPILFNGPMVRAILSGRKTQTRRVITPQPFHALAGPCEWYTQNKVDREGAMWPGDRVYGFEDETVGYVSKFGAPGDRLWVKETFLHPVSAITMPSGETETYYNGSKGDIRYVADGAKPEWCDLDSRGIPICGSRWRVVRPSIHMPRWASRITLEITDVRVERLQDITEEDALSEGVLGNQPLPTMCFQSLWDSINKDRGYGWDKNPFVWVIEFKKL